MKNRDSLFVITQLVLFLGYALAPNGNWINPDWLSIGSFSLFLLGAGVVSVAILQLNKNLSPFPTPVNDGHLITNGLFSIVRHPIYTGIILVSIGFGINRVSLFKCVIALLLVVLFHYKSEYEEVLLSDKYEEYKEYQKRTSKLFPFF